jgi:hypothetical protein
MIAKSNYLNSYNNVSIIYNTSILLDIVRQVDAEGTYKSTNRMSFQKQLGILNMPLLINYCNTIALQTGHA